MNKTSGLGEALVRLRANQLLDQKIAALREANIRAGAAFAAKVAEAHKAHIAFLKQYPHLDTPEFRRKCGFFELSYNELRDSFAQEVHRVIQCQNKNHLADQLLAEHLFRKMKRRRALLESLDEREMGKPQ